MRLRLVSISLVVFLASALSLGQEFKSPPAERITIHSKVLNEDRPILVRVPANAQAGKNKYPVLYLTDGDGHMGEVGGIVDFLVGHNRCSQMIIVGIPNTDRTRDLTPSHADMKAGDGTIQPFPTSGGADHFLEFIKTELFPEIEKRYPTAPYRIFAGHSFGGLLAIHTLVTHTDMFDAYIAISPSLQWDNGATLHQAQQFFAKTKELHKTLYASLGNEGTYAKDMGHNFELFQKIFATSTPKGFVVHSDLYRDEDHGSTTMLAHYAGLRTVFEGWVMPQDQLGQPAGGLKGIEQHYRALSEKFGFPVSSEAAINQYGYNLLGRKKTDEAVAALSRNVELYPGSPNVYDSLADALEAAGKVDLARENEQKAVALATEKSDPLLPQLQQHMERLTASASAGSAKDAGGGKK